MRLLYTGWREKQTLGWLSGVGSSSIVVRAWDRSDLTIFTLPSTQTKEETPPVGGGNRRVGRQMEERERRTCV